MNPGNQRLDVHDTDVRALRYRWALTRLAQCLWQSGDGLLQAFEAIAEAGARVLDVENVCIWRHEPDDRFTCMLAYVRADDLHDGAPFEARRVSAETVAQHALPSASVPRQALPGRPHTRSVLEMDISIDGESYGSVIYESSDPGRVWQPDELAFAQEMCEFLARAVQNERHRRAEVRLDYLELHDSLTGLANRPLMLGAINDLLRRQRKRPRLAALLFISLDRFYGVNEIAGEAGGDLILREIGDRINYVTPDEAIVARVESDCFAVLMPWLAQEWQAHRQAEDILIEISRPLSLEQVEFSVSASIGIAFNQSDVHATADVLLRDADLASKQAALSGRNRCEVFDSEQHRGLLDRLMIEQSLREALENDALELVYQPELDLATGRIVAAEALLRWRDVAGTLRVAGEFIDIAESSGLIVPIGRWVLHRACCDANGWPGGSDGRACTLAVNLSARQFEQPGLVEMVTEVLRDTAFDPRRLCLEITESVLMSRAESALQTLHGLKALGISLAIDDFGTGYSSLAYLKRFPVDTLKIDKSLVDGFPGDSQAHAIVSAVMALANAMQLEVVVEGVEHLGQEQALRALGCQRVQGWLYARGDSSTALVAQLKAQESGKTLFA